MSGIRHANRMCERGSDGCDESRDVVKMFGRGVFHAEHGEDTEEDGHVPLSGGVTHFWLTGGGVFC